MDSSSVQIGVIVALAEEYKAFLKYYHGKVVAKYKISEKLTFDLVRSEAGHQDVLLLCVNDMGNVSAAIAATNLLNAFDLEVVVNIGLAAGLKQGEQQLGDVIVADQITHYEAGKLKSDGLQKALKTISLSSPFIDQLKTADYESWPLGTSIGGQPRQVHFGTVASGEKVIADAKFADLLRESDRKTIGAEMESYGIATATAGRAEYFLFIRGICDFGDNAKNDNARLSAMDGAVRFFTEALRRGLIGAKSRKTDGNATLDYKIVEAAGVAGRALGTFLVKRQKTVNGIANTDISFERTTSTVDDFHFRKSVIDRMQQNFDIDDLRVFCIQLSVDFDNLPGNTKKAKTASLLDYVDRRELMTLDELAQLAE